jgi:hypothetical protein
MDDIEPRPREDIDDGPVELDGPVETMSMKDSFGTAVGSAMLGFEQALRNEPPAETLAAEHMPERDQISGDDGTTIIWPEPVERRSPR